MQVSRWEINKIGLIDFWYYDEQEFEFIDGRMLLRGSNGSGKSVTMQSFIPLLLDGNKASERLDPFGTKARRLENYLLEEGDDRQERTGYLYMEFKRRESDTFLTVGIGLCARKNKKLDAWHFVITDGRRVGKDFFLYKETKERIALSKKELTARLGEGGQVIEGQKDYMRMVNEKLFGFETADEYKELVDLLIQLRTPKLSKDFKPTVLNEILSGSLPPLSDEDLRPMSEAIENMDNLKAQLESLEESRKASEKILEVYEAYNRCVLYEKSKKYVDARDAWQTAEQRMETLKKETENSRNLFQEQEQKLQELLIEEETLKKQKEDLDQNDVSRLVEKKQTLEQEITGFEEQEKKKKQSLEQKREQEIELTKAQKEKETDAEQKADAMREQLDEMEAGLETVSLDEHSFMAEELLAEIEKPYSFRTLNGQVEKLADHVKQGIRILEEEKRQAEKLEEKQVDGAKKKKEKERLEREKEQQISVCEEAKSAWEEQFYQWLRSNQFLSLEDTLEKQIITTIQKFAADSDFSEVREPVREAKETKKMAFGEEKLILKNQITQSRQELAEVEQELKDWIEKKDPQPEHDEAVEKNRQWMRKQGIAFEPLYQVIDFADDVTQDQKNRLEEALLHMGLLDAAVVPDHEKKRVLQMREGMWDTYLFSGKEILQDNIQKFLEISIEMNDIVFYQQLSSILGQIQTTDGDTFLRADGVFQQGILTGTISGDYQAKYIGVKARQAYKQEQIARLQQEIEHRQLELTQLEKKEQEIIENMQCLEEEFQSLPSEHELKSAVLELDKLERSLQQKTAEVEQVLEEIRDLRQKLDDIRLQAAEICNKVYLKSDLSVFRAAKEELDTYAKELLRLESMHKEYLHALELCQTYRQQLEAVQEDMDELRYDLGQLTRRIEKHKMEILHCEEQLKLKDYAAIKAKLDACVKRLGEIPKEYRTLSHQQGGLETKIQDLEAEAVELAQKSEKLKAHAKWVQEGLEAELALGYVEEKQESDEESIEKKAARFVKILWQGSGKNSMDLSGELQERYHRYKGEMAEFGLVVKKLFQREADSEGSGSSFTRLDILGKYKGREVTFPVLVRGLQEDVETQKNLVKESDRSLFEEILAQTVGKKIRQKIYNSEKWVETMNRLMGSMNTSSGLRLSLIWKKKKAEEEGQLDTGELVRLLKKDAGLMTEEEMEQLSAHFQSKVEEARRQMEDTGNTRSFHAIMKEILDYRKWFEFQLFYEKTGEKKRELTNNAFFTFSGGEKAMSMYVPLFSAVVAKYQGARADAPRLISLDEAFAGVDDTNIRDMFRLMVELDFEFIINSQILWGDCDTVPSLAIYQLIRPENAKYVSVLPYRWNGKVRELVTE